MTIHSFYKLDNYLKSKGFKVQRAFCIDGMCVYLQTFSESTGCSFFVYIPSRYNLPCPENIRSYKISYISNDDKCGGGDDEDERGMYDGVKLEDDNGDLKRQLTEFYKQDIPLSSIETTEQREVAIVRDQLTRLKSCVASIDYKLVIQYDNYLGAITRNNDVQMYMINGMDYNCIGRQLFTSIDLSALYARTSHVATDVLEVKNKVHGILRDIYNKQMTKMNEVLARVESAQKHINTLKSKQEAFNVKTRELSDAYIRLSKEQESLGEPLRNVALFNKNAKERRIEDIIALKSEIMDELVRRNAEQDNVLLVSDHYLFDNIVSLQRVAKNIETLRGVL